MQDQKVLIRMGIFLSFAPEFSGERACRVGQR
jgi:hypothetical protein